jgi:2-polyprenyl-3-methyl-5-hydroxy-6-metoxy-1,4-benzoquinol methylase
MRANDYNAYAAQRAGERAANKNLFHAYTEKPAMFSLLPDVVDAEVLSVGCGTGEECMELYTRGANVSGFDLSEASVEYAQKQVPAEVDLWVQNMDDPAAFGELEPNHFDLAYSSMTLQAPSKVFVAY